MVFHLRGYDGGWNIGRDPIGSLEGRTGDGFTFGGDFGGRLQCPTFTQRYGQGRGCLETWLGYCDYE